MAKKQGLNGTQAKTQHLGTFKAWAAIQTDDDFRQLTIDADSK